MKPVLLLWGLLLALSAYLDVGIAVAGIDIETEYDRLEVAKQWKLLTYDFPPRLPVNDPNFYNPQNVLITGIAVHTDRVFIATPKLFSGVPSTLNFVPKSNFGDSPPLQAYPDWSFYTTGRSGFNCSDLVLISVYRLRIDSCNRLWVLDSGISRSIEDFEVTCPPKILIFDLKTDQLVRRVDFPQEILRGESLFTNLVIDETTSTSPTCDDAFAYISDTVEAGIIVYDSGRDITWRVSHPAMYPDPDFAETTILDNRFVLMDGIVGMTFDPKLGLVYFQPLATNRIFSVHKNVLRAGPIAINQVLDVKLVGKKSSQGIGLAVSPLDGSLFFSPMTETAIASWNPNTNQQSILAKNQEILQFVADITVTSSEPGVIYAISSKFHRFFLKNLNPNEVNNRIIRFDTNKLTLSSPYYIPNKPLNSLTTSIQSATPLYTYSKPPKYPLSYQHLDVFNYNIQQPFNTFNKGETLTSASKGQQHKYEISYLDGLSTQPDPINVDEDDKVGYQSLLPSVGNIYYYDRSVRSTEADEATDDSLEKKKKK